MKVIYTLNLFKSQFYMFILDIFSLRKVISFVIF
ncbi:hypothetical protein SAMN05421761_10127 [Belliella pelovolcani]|uniref:Uncharacterized protein n=1 Tax=Belliella pelovolcani TaxID=529505 RepID=A0A1N7JI65_9BACT|nr:hypothetical protein SAMN05421761_10127 [Belliella pelovolcani]